LICDYIITDQALTPFFHETYAGIPKLAPRVREIALSLNINIMERCKDPLEREFYIRMTRKFGWSKNVLIHRHHSLQGKEPHGG
jgi:hypothetical protein